MEKVLCAMSGGVDSSVLLVLLKKSGYSPYGVTMQLLSGIKGVQMSDEYLSAKSVADYVGVPFECVDYSGDFEEKVIKDFVSAYENGETPNPCVMCNKYLKFGRLFEKADEMGINYIATGHYVRKEEKNGRFYIKKAVDEKKDQTYVLCNLTQEKLKRLMFPLGDYTKSDIRRIAEEENLPVAHKSESMDICFVPDGDYFSFLAAYSGDKSEKGNFLSVKGDIIGTHNGYMRYTIGQRRGLGMGFSERMYVLSTNPEKNTVTLCRDDELLSDTMYLYDVNMISGEEIVKPFEANVRIRYLHKEQPAVCTPLGQNRMKIVFKEPQRAISKGQWGVIYDGEYLLGGGKIATE